MAARTNEGCQNRVSSNARQLPLAAHPAVKPMNTAKGRINMSGLRKLSNTRRRLRPGGKGKVPLPEDTAPTSELQVPGRTVRLP